MKATAKTPGDVREDRALSATDLRSLRDIEWAAASLLAQCAHLRRNGRGDEIRFGLIASHAFDCWKAAVRADNRTAKTRGLHRFKWRIPKRWVA